MEKLFYKKLTGKKESLIKERPDNIFSKKREERVENRNLTLKTDYFGKKYK